MDKEIKYEFGQGPGELFEGEYKKPLPMRLDRWLVSQRAEQSRAHIQKFIEAGFARVNGKTGKAKTPGRPGDIIQLWVPPPEPLPYLKPEEIDLNILYEDDHLIVINKTAGIAVHPAPGNKSGTLVNGLINHCPDLPGIGGKLRPGIVHRLDKDTSGILVVAKNNNVHINLAEQFKEHTISRRYKAIVWGTPDNQSIEGYIERNRKNRKKMSLNNKGFGKYSKTDIKLEKTFGIASLVDCHLHTGRTHQIRLHLTSKNSPIIGDKIYGKSKINQFGKDKNTFNKFMILKNFERQALHAYHLGFDHPTSKKRMDFDIEIPEDFKNLIELLLKY